MPNSVDHSQFFSEIRGKQPAPTIEFLYSMAKFKGVDVAMQAINILCVAYPNLRVVAFRSVMPDKNTDFYSRIEFYYSPDQDKIRDLYAQCDVWLTASRTEGFNLPAMEAMAYRMPVVTTKAGWPEEAIVDGKNGFLVDVDDVNTLAHGAASILSLSGKAWREMSANAYVTVASSTWQSSADQFEAVLERVCQQNRYLSNIPVQTI